MLEYLGAFLSVFLLFAVPGVVCAVLVAVGDKLERAYHRRQWRRQKR